MIATNKKGYFLSLDALIALTIILGIVLIIKPPVSQFPGQVNLQEDILLALSSIKVSEINNSYVQSLISSGEITNINQSVLEQIGEFYANGNPEATLMAENILSELNLDENIGLYFNNLLIANSSQDSINEADNIWTSRQIISGIQAGESAKGYSSRAFLISSDKVDYIYFGGYVGDGNISVNVGDGIENVEIEAVFSRDFTLLINNQSIQQYSPTFNVPYEINLANHISKFNLSENTITFKGVQGNLYIAGGFIKITRDETQAVSSISQFNFPGIDGLVNIYDSFYVPGNLTNMEIYLHYNSNQNLFLTIGNQTVFRGNSSIDTTKTITNSNLSSLFNYSALNEKTIPVRLGIENVSHTFNETLDVDVISVTDLSGSMADSCSGYSPWWCCWGGSCSQSTCTSCGGTYEQKITAAKTANRNFIDIVLNSTKNRVGLVGYKTSYDVNSYHNLSKNNVTLKAKVDSWTISGNTCVCCGINRAMADLVANSSATKFRSMVVMSDGEANQQCSQQGTGNAKQDAIQAACQAYNNYGIIVYSVGFGADADEATMQAISSCGGGSYYYSSANDIATVYQEIAEEVLEAAYLEQTVVGNLQTKLHPDSYIKVTYTKNTPYGLIISSESPTFGNAISQGSFVVPNNTDPYEVKVISYSSSRWTDNVAVSNNGNPSFTNVFNLSEYNDEYVNLGDPYVINIPINNIVKGNNTIKVSTGLSATNSTGGSPYNKILYSLRKNVTSYSPIVSSAVGCNWLIQFEDLTNVSLSAPPSYSGNKSCEYSSNQISYNDNDAIDIAIYRLLLALDLNANNLIETKFTENDVSLSSTEVEGIPFTWDTEVQIRVWR